MISNDVISRAISHFQVFIISRLVALSGAGIGEVPDQVREIYRMTGVSKIKPHEGCGKARLVLERSGVVHPSDQEVNQFAKEAAVSLAEQIGVEVGRTIGFDDRKTRLVRPPDHHPANQAVVVLSGRLPHNLLPSRVLNQLPPRYNLEGTYLGDEDLHPVAIGEMSLVVSIASGGHGVGIVPEGFQFTAIADKQDPDLSAKLGGLKEAFAVAQDALELRRGAGETLNTVSLDVVGYRIHSNGEGPSVSFEQIE